jgi:hypothetical protein
LGINSQWISTEDNKIADDISRLKRASSSSTSPLLLIIPRYRRCTRNWRLVLISTRHPSCSRSSGRSS